MKYPLQALLLALLALASLLPAPAAAQDQPVTMEVRPGLDGAGKFRVSHWFPVTVTVANTGGDVRGTVVLRFPGQESGVFRYDLDLPRGARKQITLPVTSTDTTRNAVITFEAGGSSLARTVINLDPLTTDQYVIGVISSNLTLLNSLAAFSPPNGGTTAVVHIDPLQLPSDPMLLGGIDTLFVHDLATADLAAGQIGALAGWAELGGTLVVSGGPAAERSVPGLADLLPVDVGPLRPDIPSDSLGVLARQNDIANLLPTLTANATTLRPDGRALEPAGLLSSRDLGAGRVIFAAFDLAALQPWGGEAALWGRVMRQEPRAQIGSSYRMRSENLLRDSLRLPALNVPSTFAILGLILLYIVVVGPVNFLVLRRLRRVELAWVTTPILVALFLGGAYSSSLLLRGSRPQLTQLAVVQAVEGSSSGNATAFIGLFSPIRRGYELGFGPDALITPGAFEGFSFRGAPVSGSDTGVAVRDLLVDVASLRTLIAEQPVSDLPQIESSLQRNGGVISGELRNASGLTLTDALVVIGDSMQPADTLEPGESIQVNLRSSQNNFPDQIPPLSSELFERRQVIYSLFGYDRFALGGPVFQGDNGIPERDGVYLLAWATQPAVAVSLDGADIPQQAQTLYIIRLDG